MPPRHPAAVTPAVSRGVSGLSAVVPETKTFILMHFKARTTTFEIFLNIYLYLFHAKFSEGHDDLTKPHYHECEENRGKLGTSPSCPWETVVRSESVQEHEPNCLWRREMPAVGPSFALISLPCAYCGNEGKEVVYFCVERLEQTSDFLPTHEGPFRIYSPPELFHTSIYYICRRRSVVINLSVGLLVL